MCRQKTEKKCNASIYSASLEVYANLMSWNNVQINLVEFMPLCFQLTTTLVVVSCKNKHRCILCFVDWCVSPCIIL
jgi:hypothetical protein